MRAFLAAIAAMIVISVAANWALMEWDGPPGGASSSVRLSD